MAGTNLEKAQSHLKLAEKTERHDIGQDVSSTVFIETQFVIAYLLLEAVQELRRAAALFEGVLK